MAQTKSVIRATNVGKQLGKKTVLEHISLEIQSAETFGLLGPSGSGKTTLVKLLIGIDEATSGKIEVFDTVMPNLAMLSQIGYMAQSDALYTELSALENLEFYAALYGLKGARQKQRISAVMEVVSLEQHLHKRVAQYSGGMKRRLSLAIALLHEPPLLVLDEPTVGIDPLLRQAIWTELKALNAIGTTIIMTTHVMDEAEKCDRLGMIRDGHLIAVDTPDVLIQQAGKSSIEEAFIHYGGVQL